MKSTRRAAGAALDKIDQRILSRLQDDGRLSIAQLARELHISVTPCVERVRRLEESGHIVGYRAELSPGHLGQNLLARSLHEQAYDHNPGFRRFVEQNGLTFSAHGQFKKADLDARQQLYRALAERIWSPERLAQEAAS